MPLETENGVHYSFALEYNGPPLSYDLPRAVPINVKQIPVAAVVSHLSLPDKLSLPVVKPLLPAGPGKNLSKELKSIVSQKEPGSEEAATTVSPTLVIDRAIESNQDCRLSGELTSSGALEFSTGPCGSPCISKELSIELLNGGRSSSTIEFSDSFDNKSRESTSRLRVSNELSQDWASSESVLSIDYPSSRVSSLKPSGECHTHNEGNEDGRRARVVAFCDVESDNGVVGGDYSEELGEEEPRFVRVKREPQSKGKKGTCYRCFKGNRFTEKEVCIVCDAKYCSSCVLRAMGSMPEGRKCVTCIGYPIDESKRGSLGKCSRMLKRLLNDLEIRQIMKAEKLCEANQLPPEFVCVNGMPLSHEELVVLQSCPNPPKKLKPGSYWYDKVSGLWGKEGQKPSQIISPHLNVGGPINVNASNGNTQVYINGREITKVELRMLQLAGVQCAGNPHFWVNEDGSYQEEGQKNTKGYIWGKAGMKLVCAFLSLPVPAKSSNSCGEQVNSMMSRSVPDYIEQRTLQKILLVGYSGSGKSTIFKQAKILYKPVPFTEEERENIKMTIQSNVYGYLGSSNGINCKTIYSIGPRLKAFSDWLLKIMVAGNLEVIFPAATREYAPLVEELWKDPAIQATYNRRNELEMLPSVASYFLERAVDVLRTDYEPSDLDILYAEGVTSSNGLACSDFSFPPSALDDKFDSDDPNDSLLRYQLISVHARGWERTASGLRCLKMLGWRFFESIVTHPTFDQMDFLLLLNKFDLLEEKIERVPLTECEWFDDFHPVISRHKSSGNRNSINCNPSIGQLVFHHVAVKFKKLYASLTGKKLYVSLVRGLEPDSVDGALKYAREILKWEEERPNFSLSEYSFYSNEASPYSP
ncbi:hypothetical protein GH714_031644 [Hevea brasiliensis]|uniref:Extra-large guanine nucleotide-binding protein 1 n=1 Tax=Hevea brasiliensis TaxID=3981 RepID=A0A6A6L2I7_HEVBR|nr:hypothetical protein GH714_031644 [Hevea brasiliensis]